MEMPSGKVIVANVIESIYKSRDHKQSAILTGRDLMRTFVKSY